MQDERRVTRTDVPLEGRPLSGSGLAPGSNQGVAQAASDERPRVDKSGRFHIVGIGASAGGLESLERLFTNMPANTGMAFVVIQHLSPDFKSLMDELLARHTDLPIHRAEDGMAVSANSIYLIPPKKEMIISDGRLLLNDKDPKQALSMPIDRFFRSLAQDAGKRAIGVILSGTGSDGSRGICEIHNAGGLVLCETKESAKFDGMPQAALETGVVDQALPSPGIPQALVEYTRRSASAEVPDDVPPLEAIEVVFKLLNDAYGIDFSHYKPNTVSRRIQRRLAMVGVRSVDEYAERLHSDADELNALYKDLLIGVTRFFRDRDAFAQLESAVVPELVRRAATEEEIRVWVAGCATGEEAYSLAMIIHEQLAAAGQPINVKIFATDVHRVSLDNAGAGLYGEEALQDVAPERLERYFHKGPGGYRVSPDLRQMIVFAKHNAINDAPFTKLDLITCRNLLIYFQPQAQQKALSLFQFGLKTGGYLFLGPSESPGQLLDELEIVDSHWKIYKKCRDVRLPVDLGLPLRRGAPALHSTKMVSAPSPTATADPSLIGAYDKLLDRYMPPALLINERHELLHVFGGAECYLKTRSGRPSGDALEMLDRELRTAVTGAVQRALRDLTPVSYSGVRVGDNGDGTRLRVAVEPVDNPRSRLAQLLILIEPMEAPEAEARTEAAERTEASMRQVSADHIESLESDLRYTKENLQATIEELETSNEEMQATNEELVASNEELQSTNEELQSVNEELYTVNGEYQKKIAELSEMTSDMDNLLESTDVGTIFLDRDLNIRRFTPQIGLEFHLLPQDIGRPIDSFAHNVEHPELIDDLRRVVQTEQPCEREVRDRQGKWLFLRILPYRTKAKRIDGVVLTLIEITQVKRAQAELSNAVERRDEFLAMLSHELRNPLGAILNASHVIDQMTVENATLHEPIQVVRRQGRLMSRLLDDLLDVSRVTQNKIELHTQELDLRATVESAIESAQPLIDSNQLTLETSFADEPLSVVGDPARLQQVISNLLANAAKYTPPGGRVTLVTGIEANDVVVRIRDTGVGLPSNETESIFELFVQSDHALDRSDGGMGVGLTLVRSIVEMHAGSVSASSAGADQGSEFVVRLPREGGMPTRRPNSAQVEHQMVPPKQSGGCIVVVEDQDDARRMLRTLLELQGFEVHEAENGTKGLAVIERYRPGVALIDIGLPGIDGYELARQLRQNLGINDTYLVALTGYGQPSDVESAFEAGFNNHLVKPLDPVRLARILNFHSHLDETRTTPGDQEDPPKNNSQ